MRSEKFKIFNEKEYDGDIDIGFVDGKLSITVRNNPLAYEKVRRAIKRIQEKGGDAYLHSLYNDRARFIVRPIRRDKDGEYPLWTCSTCDSKNKANEPSCPECGDEKP